MIEARLSALLLALTAAAIVHPPAAEAQWDKPIDWLLPCSALLEATFGADSPLCDDLHNEGRIKDTLDEASRILESLGFGSPAISASLDLASHMEDADAASQALQIANQHDPRCENRYCAWLVYSLEGEGAYSDSDRSLVLDPFRISDDGQLQPGYNDAFGFAEVHELFHAVQYGYPEVEAAEDDWVEWIIEGTAEHVARAVGRPVGLSVGGTAWFRTYDQPLHSPPQEDLDDAASRNWAYGSSEFFDFLGEYLGSDLGIQYLAHLFQTLAPGQNNGLLAVEAAVRHESGKGLYEAFPEFVARRLVYPCYFTDLGTWKDGDCADGPDNEHRFALTYPDTIQRLDHTAADVSATGYLVRMEVPEGKTGLLTIRVPPDQDEDYLHLIVGDERRDAPGIVGRRNEYTTLLPAGPHEVFARLANVPRDLADADPEAGLDFTADDPAPIEFFALYSYARTTSFSNSPGPSADEVDQPIDVGFDRVLRGLVTDRPGGDLEVDRLRRLGFDPGLAEPCVLMASLGGDAWGDGLSLRMFHEGPIGPDDYPVANGRELEYGDPWPPGMAGVGFGFGPDNPLSGGDLQSFVGMAGTLHITSVDGRFVQGVLDVSGENRLAERIALGDPPPAVYVPNATIRVEFGLLMQDPGELGADSGAHECLTSEKSPGGAAPGTGGDPAGSPSDESADPGTPSDDPGDPGTPSDPSGSSQTEGAGGAPDESPPDSAGDTAADPPDDAESAARPSDAAADALGPGGTRWVSVRAEGRPDLSFHGSDVDGSAGAGFSCFGTAGPAHLYLYEGPSGQTATLGLNVITPTGIAEGATGAYRADQVLYVVDGGSLDWRGPVSLELSRHDASTDPGARRVTGRILGLSVVDRETGALIPVDAEFDVNAACAPFGR